MGPKRKIKRQNVSWAARTFSATVAAFMRFTGEPDKAAVIDIIDKVNTMYL